MPEASSAVTEQWSNIWGDDCGTSTGIAWVSVSVRTSSSATLDPAARRTVLTSSPILLGSSSGTGATWTVRRGRWWLVNLALSQGRWALGQGWARRIPCIMVAPHVAIARRCRNNGKLISSDAGVMRRRRRQMRAISRPYRADFLQVRCTLTRFSFSLPRCPLDLPF